MLIRNYRYVVRSGVFRDLAAVQETPEWASCSWRFTQFGRVVRLKRSCVSRQVHEGGCPCHLLSNPKLLQARGKLAASPQSTAYPKQLVMLQLRAQSSRGR